VLAAIYSSLRASDKEMLTSSKGLQSNR